MSILPSVIHSAVCMLDGNLDTNTWFFATKLSVPFSTSSVFGWYMLVTWQTFSATTFLFVLTAIITYLLSCCFYVQALRDHFKSTFDKIDTKIVADATASTDEVNTETLVALEKVVSFHVKSMEWAITGRDSFLVLFDWGKTYSFCRIFKTIGYISSGTIFYQLITYVIFVAMGIFHLEQVSFFLLNHRKCRNSWVNKLCDFRVCSISIIRHLWHSLWYFVVCSGVFSCVTQQIYQRMLLRASVILFTARTGENILYFTENTSCFWFFAPSLPLILRASKWFGAHWKVSAR